jgi:cellulose synthase/poly-beta-1,6-N-acetylglucosamine synthase-like glycosyltransferase
MLDIGTRADDYAIAKLYKYMKNNENCGGCCGEIEVDFSTHQGYDVSYMVKAA